MAGRHGLTYAEKRRVRSMTGDSGLSLKALDSEINEDKSTGERGRRP